MHRPLLLPAVLLAGCGGATPAPTTPARAPSPAATTRSATSPPAPQAATAPPIIPARCPRPHSDACTAHTGIVLSLESVDPDGDGDLHVIASGGSTTFPGITVFDVSKAIRPGRDPRPGDRVTGAGPVYRGSHGQRQIQVTSFRVARVRR